MTGQVEHVGVEPLAIDLLDHLGRQTMQAQPLDRAEGGFDGIPDHGVAEAVVPGRGGGLHQCRSGGLVQCDQAAPDRQVDHLADDGNREVVADDRGRPKQPHTVTRESTQPRADHLAQVGGHRNGRAAVGLGHRVGDLLDEERITASQCTRPLDLGVGDLAAQPGRQLPGHGCNGQTTQGQLSRHRLPRQRGQCACKGFRVPAVHHQ